MTSWNFRKNKSFLLNWIEELPLLLRAEIFAQKDSFDDVTWTFELALLSRAEIFAKIRQFWWCHSSVWPAPVITNWNFSQTKAVLMILLENLNCPFITSSNVHENSPDLMKLLEYLNCLFYHEAIFFAKIRYLCWCDLIIYSAPIVKSWSFCKK